MLQRIEEIKQALKNNMPEAALALTLTLPDICGQVAQPNENGVGKRYTNWIRSNVPQSAFDLNYDGTITDLNGGVDPKISKLTPEAIYKLRCHFLHSGDADIQNENSVQDMDYFVLKRIDSGNITDEKGFGVRSGFACYVERDDDGKETKHYEIDAGYLCRVICEAAESYYLNFPDKESFDNHRVCIVD